MHITNGTQISNQGGFINSFSSEIQITDTIFSDMSLDASALTLISTNMTMQSSMATGLTSSGSNSYPFITSSLDSVVDISELTYSDDSVSMMTALSSTVIIDSLTLFNVNSMLQIMYVDQSTLTMTNSHIMNISSSSTNSVFKYSDSQVLLNQNVTFSDIGQTAIDIESTTVANMSQINISKSERALSLSKKSDVYIENSTFMDLGATTVTKGGAINCKNSNITVQSSSFTNNTAQEGGINLE